jgi:DNA invertase Pin-like site-specific DNA recombinase
LKVAAYLRVSTDRQAEEGLGLAIQRGAIAEWSRTHGHEIVGWYADEGISGSNGLDTRIALPDALEQVRTGRAAAVVVYRLDRLARDLIVQETLLSEIKRIGGVVHSTAASESIYLVDDPEDPSRRLIRQVLGAVSEYERSMIALRLRSGRRLKAQQGGFAFGSPPMGYVAKNGELSQDPAEQAALKRARDLRREGHSLRQTAAVLAEEGHTAKRGGPWHPTTLARALAREEGRDG